MHVSSSYPNGENNNVDFISSMVSCNVNISTPLSGERNYNDIVHTPSIDCLQPNLSTSVDRKYSYIGVLDDISNFITNLDKKFYSVSMFLA